MAVIFKLRPLGTSCCASRQHEPPRDKSRTLEIVAGAVEKVHSKHGMISTYPMDVLAKTMRIAVFEEPHSDGSVHHHVYLGFDAKTTIIALLPPVLQTDSLNIEVQVPNLTSGRTPHKVRILRYLAVPTDEKPTVDTAPLLFNMEIPAEVLATSPASVCLATPVSARR